jgi:hypothetical protein
MPPLKELGMPAKKRMVKVIKSASGEFTFPTIMVNGREKSLTCFPDRWILLPKEFVDDEYVLDAETKGLVLVQESETIPENPKQYPDIIETDSSAKNWLNSLLLGEYTDQMKSYLVDWRNSRLITPGRIGTLKQRILPLVQCAMEREREGKNRADLIADLERMANYILKEEWQWDNVQSASRGSARP